MFKLLSLFLCVTLCYSLEEGRWVGTAVRVADQVAWEVELFFWKDPADVYHYSAHNLNDTQPALGFGNDRESQRKTVINMGNQWIMRYNANLRNNMNATVSDIFVTNFGFEMFFRIVHTNFNGEETEVRFALKKDVTVTTVQMCYNYCRQEGHHSGFCNFTAQSCVFSRYYYESSPSTDIEPTVTYNATVEYHVDIQSGQSSPHVGTIMLFLVLPLLCCFVVACCRLCRRRQNASVATHVATPMKKVVPQAPQVPYPYTPVYPTQFYPAQQNPGYYPQYYFVPVAQQ